MLTHSFQTLDEFRQYSRFNQGIIWRHASLTSIEELSPCCSLGRQVNIGFARHDYRRFPTKLHCHWGKMFGGSSHDNLADGAVPSIENVAVRVFEQGGHNLCRTIDDAIARAIDVLGQKGGHYLGSPRGNFTKAVCQHEIEVPMRCSPRLEDGRIAGSNECNKWEQSWKVSSEQLSSFG